MAFEVVDRELAELLVGEAFVAFGTGIVEKQAAELDFEPCWGERVTVHLNDYLCDSGGDDACILLTGQVHSLVFELRELLVEFLYGQVVKLGYSIVTVWLIGSFCESDFTGTLNEEKIGLLVPIKRVYSEVFGASDKDKGTLRIKCTVEAWTSWASWYSDDERVFEGVSLRGEVTIVVGLRWSNIKIPSIIRMGQKSDR